MRCAAAEVPHVSAWCHGLITLYLKDTVEQPAGQLAEEVKTEYG